MTDKEILSWIDTVIADYMYPDVEEELIEVRSKVHDLFESYEMLAKRDWIPVSERLPDTDDKVLCWYEYYHWSQEKVLPEYGIGGYLRETSAWFGEVANGKDVRVIAWMPLPPSYQGKSKIEQTLAYADQDTMMPAT